MKKLTLLCICLLFTACATDPVVDSGKSLDGYSKAVLTVRGMSCPLCSNNLDGRLKKIPGIESVKIDLKTGLVTVLFNADTPPTIEQIKIAVKEAGFTLSAIEPQQ